jgi:hypothetical protein
VTAAAYVAVRLEANMSNSLGRVGVCLVAGTLIVGCGRPEHDAPAEQRRDQVEQLLRTTLDQLALHQYDEAEQTIDAALAKDPGNEEALKLRELTTEARHQVAQGDQDDRDSPRTEWRPRSRVRAGGARPSADVVEGERLLDEGRYAEAEACFRRALALEPGNEEARALLNGAQSLAAQEAIAYGGVTHMPGVYFPSKEHWAKVRRRSGCSHTSSEPEWIRAYRQVLSSRKVTLNFPDTTLAEAISFLQDVTGLNLVVSPAVDQQEITVSLRLREIPLGDALRIIVEQTQLVMTFENEALCFGLPPPCSDHELEIYDVQDLVRWVGERVHEDRRRDEPERGAPREGVLDADELERIVTTEVGEDAWDDPASIELHRGQLIVNQTRAVHSSLREVLRDLRTRQLQQRD